MKFIAHINTPGHLPDMNDEPATYDTPAEAWRYLYHERCQAEREAPCDLCGDTMTHGPEGDCDDDSETGEALAKHARWASSGLVTQEEAVGVVYGPTPGYSVTGIGQDLGLAYSVEVLEAMYEEGTPEWIAAHGEPMGDDE